jgi:RNA polymerase sigma-70 factor, ECF subfamily
VRPHSLPPAAVPQSSLSLAAIVERARSDDPTAIDALYDAYATALLRLAFRLLASREDAEDVVQDVFVGLPLALRRYEERGHFEHWLKRLTARTALMRLRAPSAARREPLHEVSLRSPEDQLLARLALETAIERLPHTLRSVFVLREIEQFSHEEIAELLGIRRGTSEVRLHRAIRTLRDFLESSR